MKILSISLDRNILKPQSEEQRRMLEYGRLVEEYHVLVLNTSVFERVEPLHLGGSVFIYATNSKTKAHIMKDAYSLGKSILEKGGYAYAGLRDWVITTQDPFETALIGYWLKQKFRMSLNIQEHGDFFSEPYWRSESLHNRSRYFLGKYLLRKADSVRVVSCRVGKTMEKIGVVPRKIVVVPIHRDMEQLQAQSIRVDLHAKYPSFDFIILSMGRFVKQKNIPLLLSSFQQVLRIFPKTLLLLVGTGQEEESLRMLASTFRVTENVAFEDWTQDTASYYKTADLFVLCSNYEGFGRVIPEALACGLPVVSTDVGCAQDLIVHEQNGMIVPVNSRDLLTEAILRIMGDKDMRDRMKENASKSVDILPSKEETLLLYKESWERAYENYYCHAVSP